MTEEKTENIIEKIRKLMALGNSPNENEASLAMQKVQEILAKYNLSMAEVDAHSIKDNGNIVDDAPRKKETLNKNAMYHYQRTLMAKIAQVHYCLHFVYEKKDWSGKRVKVKKYHVLVGKEVNVVSAQLMFDYLNKTIEKLANEIYPNPLNLSKSAMSWKEGCSHRLQERLQERKVEADRIQAEKAKEYNQTHHNGTGLMLLTDVRQNEYDLNQDFMYGDKPGSTMARRMKWEVERKNRPVVEEKPLSAAEQKKAQEQWEKWCQKEKKKRDRHWANKDISAYLNGFEKANDVGLDTQVSTTPNKAIN